MEFIENIDLFHKVDDDIFVNTERVWSTLKNAKINSMMLHDKMIDYVIIGRLLDTVPFRVATHKNYISSRIYPGDKFPLLVK